MRQKKPAVPLSILAVLLVVLPSVALARAGGGQSYGDSGGGGGGGGGEGMGYLVFWLVQLAFRHPVIGVPLLVFALVMMIRFGRRARAGSEIRTISRAGRAASETRQRDVDARLAALAARDPGFDPALFVERSGRAFTEVQKAWAAGDPGMVRRFVSDGIRERFSIQLEMMRARGIRNELADPAIVRTEIVALQSDQCFDTIHLAFTASGRDRDLDVPTGRVLADRGVETFTEYWSFLRRPGASTKRGAGLVEGFCPNCGASLEISDAGRCENCDSIVTSGEYDWILAEITQSAEWGTMSDPAVIPGYERMVSRDPAFNLQHVEDRVSVIFWRYIRAHFENSPSRLARMATPGYVESLAESIRLAGQDGRWLVFEEAAVGAVEVQSIEAGEGQGGMDRISVLVRWSARNARRGPDGRVTGAGDRMIRPTVFHLVRGGGIQTQREKAFLSSHCQACGAPDTGGDSGSCDYCGRVMNDGSQDWVLAATGRFEASMIRPGGVSAFARASLVPPDVILSAMAAAMHSDGSIDEGEMELLRSFAASRGIKPGAVDEIAASVRAGGQLPAPGSPSEASEIVAAVARMILADGKVTRPEAEMLHGFGRAAGLTRADVDMVVSRERGRLYREARAASRA